MKQALLETHMKTAYNYASQSHCKRRQVGCVIVKGDKIISIGINGTYPGFDNKCEDCNGNTLPEVIHAEANAIAKLAKGIDGGENSTVFVTVAPCLDCAKQLATMKIAALYYSEDYRNRAGLDYLEKCGIPFFHLPIHYKDNTCQNKCQMNDSPKLLKALRALWAKLK